MTRIWQSLAILQSFGLVVALPALGAPPKVGDRIDFQGPTLDGKSVGSRALRGKMVLLEFWSTTCPICIANVGHMVQLKEQFGPQGLEIVGVCLNDEPQAPRKFVKDNGWTWPQILDRPGSRLQRQFDVDGTPTLLLVNPEGVLAWSGDIDELDKAVAEQMQKTPPRLPAARPEPKPTPSAPKTADSDNAKAKSALSVAAAYKAAGKNDLARQRYEQVIKDFPGTPQAEEAKAELAKLPK
jgi:peroxiredoxin